MKQHLIGLDSLAIGHLPVHRDPRIKLAEHRIDPCHTADYRRLTGDDRSVRQTLCRNQLCGDVAATDIFRKRPTNGGINFSGKIGKCQVRHGRLHMV
ncbi:hypothetical protein D3C77_652660 [compost metagenome]